MSKRRKRNRHSKLQMPPAAERGFRGVVVTILGAAILLSLGIWSWKSRSFDVPSVEETLTEASAANQRGAETKADFQKLRGRWQRPDGGYIFEVKSVAADGAMDAAYFNPKSIRVAKAEASRDADAMKVFIELRDVNYPGSTYTLTYNPASDQLKGIYYQAAEKQRFEVAFVRMK